MASIAMPVMAVNEPAFKVIGPSGTVDFALDDPPFMSWFLRRSEVMAEAVQRGRGRNQPPTTLNR